MLARRFGVLPVFVRVLLDLARLQNGSILHNTALLLLLVDFRTGILVRLVAASDDRLLQDGLVGMERRHFLVPRGLTLDDCWVHHLWLGPHDLLVPPVTDDLARLQLMRGHLDHLLSLVSLHLVVVRAAAHLADLLEGRLRSSHMRSGPYLI